MGRSGEAKMPNMRKANNNTRTDRRKNATAEPHRPIVSSAHLAGNKLMELSEFEFALMMASNAFNRWVVRCMNAAGMRDLATLDVLVLHSVNHRDRPKRLADICLVLDIEDTHTVNYAMKKLVRLGLVEGEKRGKEIFYSTTGAGRNLCQDYRKIREELLVNAMSLIGQPHGDLARAADLMRALSGIYDQAARAATSL